MKDITEYVNDAQKHSKSRVDERLVRNVILADKRVVEIDLEKIVGKSADKNGSHGKFAIDEPTDNDVMDYCGLSDQELDVNERKLVQKFQSEEDFFIQGEAGWAKTQMVKKIAKKFKYTIITVYMDKIPACDLNGIAVPTKEKGGAAKQEIAMPAWAAYMLEHPEKNFLLFLDEFNQAAPTIQNACMPIILEKTICGYQFDNYFVGAAGNFEKENKYGVFQMAEPLESRFKPIIMWESNTQETWNTNFDYLHPKWDSFIGKDVVDAFQDKAMIFQNPREVEHKVFKWTYNMMQYPDNSRTTKKDDIVDRITALIDSDEDRRNRNMKGRVVDDAIDDLADIIYDKIQHKDTNTGVRDRYDTSDDLMSDEDWDLIVNGAKNGCLVENKKRVPFAKDNLSDFFEMNAEELKRILNKLEGMGIEWRFEKKKDAEAWLSKRK